MGVSEQHVRMLLRTNLLSGKKFGNQWMISPLALEDFLEGKSAKESPDHYSQYTNPKRQLDRKPVALSFFSGAMGLDLGLEAAGLHIPLTCENDNSCRKTIATNKPDVALIGDIRKYSAKDVLDYARVSKNEVDVIVGGPPCQAFSTAGARRGLDDERGNVFLKFLELIRDISPKYAVIENVRGLLSAPLIHTPHAMRNGRTLSGYEQPGGVMLLIIQLLQEYGYNVSFNLYNSANFGSPQIRERVVIICCKTEERITHLTPTHSENGEFGLPKWRTFREAIKGLPRMQHHVEFPQHRIELYKLLQPGQYWKHLPTEEHRKKALGKSYYSTGGRTGFLRRVAWDKPCPTLVTHPAMPATDLAHPELNRPLSIEEYKRIQEFPDNYKLAGSIIDQYKQVGNAVPASLGFAIGRKLINHMTGSIDAEFHGFKYSRYKYTDDYSWRIKMKKSGTTNCLK
jgi:DNA (cytosine-5)-methyltransferase 1